MKLGRGIETATPNDRRSRYEYFCNGVTLSDIKARPPKFASIGNKDSSIFLHSLFIIRHPLFDIHYSILSPMVLNVEQGIWNGEC
jgi:hypothetical protein